MNWKAKWIWREGDIAPRNFRWCVRKVFELPAGSPGAALPFTAASSSRLWVNGHEVSGGDQISPASGYLCLESERAPIEFRNILLRKLPLKKD